MKWRRDIDIDGTCLFSTMGLCPQRCTMCFSSCLLSCLDIVLGFHTFSQDTTAHVAGWYATDVMYNVYIYYILYLYYMCMIVYVYHMNHHVSLNCCATHCLICLISQERCGFTRLSCMRHKLRHVYVSQLQASELVSSRGWSSDDLRHKEEYMVSLQQDDAPPGWNCMFGARPQGLTSIGIKRPRGNGF